MEFLEVAIAVAKSDKLEDVAKHYVLCNVPVGKALGSV